MRGCKEKMMKRASVQCWSMVVKKKQGKNESKVRIRKRKKEAEIVCDEEGTSLREAEEKWKKALDEWEKYKQKKKNERDNKMLELHDVELPEETEKEKTKKSKVLKNIKKTLNRNGDFRCITNNVGKGKRGV